MSMAWGCARRVAFAGVFGILVWAGASSGRADPVPEIRVLTWNQYLGADLAPVITADSPEAFVAATAEALEQVAANRFPLRARWLAREIAHARPDLIGLQEVFDFSVDGQHGPPPFVDHLGETLRALTRRGMHYDVAAVVENLDIAVDVPGVGAVRVVDRDVILVRRGVAFRTLPGAAEQGGLCGVSVPNPAFPGFGPEFLSATPAGDGCHYTALAQVDSPVGSIAVRRGFAGIDARVRGYGLRFVNTHLEVRQPDPAQPASALIQSLQAAELLGALRATTPPERPLVLVGDVNSSPEDAAIGPLPTPYALLLGAGLRDAWSAGPLAALGAPGATCCQAPDLRNLRPQLTERIDGVFTGHARFASLASVRGGLPRAAPFGGPRWISDHAAVRVRLFPLDLSRGGLSGAE